MLFLFVFSSIIETTMVSGLFQIFTVICDLEVVFFFLTAYILVKYFIADFQHIYFLVFL